MKPTAQQLATAIRATTRRYRRGCMVRATWKTHIDHLWAKVEQAGLRRQVLDRMTR
jgi:hypothetical protein